MMRKLIATIFIGISAQLATAFEPPVDSKLVVEEDFVGGELPKGWTVQTGSWTVADGVLEGVEIKAEEHAAAARRVVKTGNAVYQFKFRLLEGSKGFHFGFDPVRGALDKKGHLFSVIVSPKSWRIMKHVDKNKPKEDPNEVLVAADQVFEIGNWYHLRVTTWGTTVKATIDGIELLTARHPTFNVEKPTLVFRALGSGMEIDELRVWTPTPRL